jgi:hypothetical protein
VQYYIEWPSKDGREPPFDADCSPFEPKS